jgi:heme-degrading monooxygenase HmoA
MYAVVVRVTLKPEQIDDVIAMANSQVVPMLKSQAGHVVSYFTRGADSTNGLSISIFESKEQAEASAATVEPPPGAPVTIDNVEVREVIASS